MLSQTHTEIPMNIYRPTEPLEATVIENRRITGLDSPNDVAHIVLDISGSRLRYLEGQSIGVIPPGTDKDGKPYKLRLYSIASPRRGDDGEHKTISICVKRANTVDPETGVVYRGVCSNYLCDSKPGDVIKLTGPVGKHFIIPQEPDANVIMIATGTGIAPFRAFLKTRYTDRVNESGQYWLFFGVQKHIDYLYGDEYEQFRKYDTFHLVMAFSREEKNPAGGRMYVQHRLQENAYTLFKLLQEPNSYIYICGLKGMEPGIMEGLEKAATDQSIVWSDFLETLKAEKRWLVEVY